MTTRSSPILRFTPTAWAKLLFFRDVGDSEIGGFGIAAEDDLLLVEDIGLVRQDCSLVHVAFDDQSVADYFDAQVDAGRRPEQFARVWIHSHPGNSAHPSQTDEQTFARVFGESTWAVMAILARGGQTFARLRFNTGPGADVSIRMEVDYSRPFPGSDAKAWQQEYAIHVRIPAPELPRDRDLQRELAADVGSLRNEDWQDAWYDDLDLEQLSQETKYDHYLDF